MKITILGSGTSTGVPLIGCSCAVCLSAHAKDKRLRSSILIESGTTKVLVDTGPDLRSQLLYHNIHNLNAVLITHGHYDHLGGLNDLRTLTLYNKDYIKCYANKDTRDIIYNNYSYMFQKNIPGQAKISLEEYQQDGLQSYVPIDIDYSLSIQPIKMVHIPKEKLETVGFVINKKIGYLTDFKWILEHEYSFLYNLDLLILGTPLFTLHPTHISVPEAIELFKIFKPKVAAITHIGHSLLHTELEKVLMVDNVIPTYDNQVFNIE